MKSTPQDSTDTPQLQNPGKYTVLLVSTVFRFGRYVLFLLATGGTPD